MKLRSPHFFCHICLAVMGTFCADSFSQAAEYENLFGRHARKHRGGETHARFHADLLILGRTGGVEPLDIVVSDPAGGPRTSLLNTTDLDLGTSLSGRYDLILSNSSPYELQFTLTGFPNGHSAQATRTDPDVTAVFYGFISGDDPDAITTRYDSEFGSGEVNLRRRLGPRVTWFSGFRVITLQEDIDFSYDLSGAGHNLNTRADNTLYGYQMGVESTVWTNGWAKVDVIGRGSVFLNHVEAGLITADPVDSSLHAHYKRQSNRTAFAGDLQATLSVPLGPGSLRIGYQAFWVNRVVLVPDQLDRINFFTGTGSFDLTNVVYHGGFVGLEVPF